MPVWIPVTLAAAFFQNLRSALQKHLTGVLSGQGAAYSRFVFALPWAIVYCFAIQHITDSSWPATSARFWLLCLSGSVTQIMASVFLLKAFSYRSFAVATVISKLEILIVALLGFILLHDVLGVGEIFGVLLCVLGLFALSAGQQRLTPTTIVKGLASPATFYSLLAALGLGASVIFFRGASLSLAHPNVLMAAAFSLTMALILQTVLMGVWLIVREPGQALKVLKSWRWSWLVGVSGMLASAGWFTAFTLQNASHVRALGQVELLFSFLVTSRVFREDVSLLEYAGCALVVVGILLVLLIGG